MDMITPLSLYEISHRLAELESALLEAGGEITADIEIDFEDLFRLEADKVSSYVALIRRFEITSQAIKLERERLQQAERSMATAADSLKSRLRDAMLLRDVREYVTPIGKVRLQRSGSRAVILHADPAELPERFVRVKIEPDKKALADSLASGNVEERADAERYATLGEQTYFVRLY